MGFEDKAFDNSSSNTTDDLQGETHNRFLPPNVVYLFNIQDNPRPQNDIDILEQNIREKSPYLLKLLLQDKTTGRYIRWACDGYAQYGSLYTAEKEILPELITGENTKIIQPRTAKSKEEQQNRTRKSAEVFTPSWICNDMNNLCDDEWLGYTNAFNTKQEHYWLTNLEKINFSGKKTWQKYVDSKRLEITCGEAPFLTSRYDTTTGEVLVVNQRIGIIDRKLRVICENTDNEADWFKWAKRAYEATYGYEFQGDNLLLARENLLYTFIDFYKHHFGKQPNLNQIKQIANILAWNIWQMDGLKECAPFDTADEAQYELFDNLPTLNFPINCRIKNWRTKKVFNFRDLKGDKTMKFDVAIGNPPYQGENHQQIYPNFYISAKHISNLVIMIFPTGWQQPKNANNLKTLNNPENKEDKQIVFINNKQYVFKDVSGAEWTNIIMWKKGFDNGLNGKQYVYINDEAPQVIHLNYDSSQIEKPEEIQKLVQIVINSNNFQTLSSFVSSLKPYGLRTDFFNNPNKYQLPKVYNERQHNTDFCIYGLENRKQVIRFIPQDYPIPKKTTACYKYKVFVGKAWGNFSSNFLGGAYSDIVIASPKEICTENFLECGIFDDFETAQKHAKYLMTRFLRALLFANKNSQDNSKEKWIYIPIQDYSEDWWKLSIEQIDEKLFEKYNIPSDIVTFIKNKIQCKDESNIVNYKE